MGDFRRICLQITRTIREILPPSTKMGGQRAGRDLHIGLRLQRSNPCVGLRALAAEYSRPGEGSFENFSKAWLALQYDPLCLAQHIWDAGGEHDFIAEALLRINQNRFARQIVALPSGIREPLIN